MTQDSGLITAQLLSRILNLSVDTIQRYTRENKIPYVRLENKHYLYNLQEVMSALNLTPAVQEKETKYTGKTSKQYNYQDYLLVPEEPGYRFEVLEGELIKDPSPTTLHQFVSQSLFRKTCAYFEKADPGGFAVYSPLDVTLGEATVVQPDILYIASDQRQIIHDTRIDGAPTLVVEILSPSTRRKDSISKLQIYQKAGVRHYWLVDPEARTFHAFAWRDGVYSLAASGETNDIVEHPDFPGLLITLQDLWNIDQCAGLKPTKL